MLAATLVAGCGGDAPKSSAAIQQQPRPVVAAEQPRKPQPPTEVAAALSEGPAVTKMTPKQTAARLARLAKRTADDGELEGAIQLYRRSLALDPDEFTVALALGDVLYRRDDYRGALEAYRQTLRLKPDHPDAVRGQANSLIGLDRPRDAAEQFRWALARAPRDHRLENGLAVALDMLGEHREAQQHYRAALALAPDATGTVNNLGLSLALSGDYAQAEAVLAKLVNSPHATPRSRQNLALVYSLMGKRERAAEIARMDLDDDAVRRNLAYYETLREKPAKDPGESKPAQDRPMTPNAAPAAVPKAARQEPLPSLPSVNVPVLPPRPAQQSAVPAAEPLPTLPKAPAAR